MLANTDRHIHEPHDRNSFGYVLFQIIGPDADWQDVGIKFGVSYAKLKGFIHSTHALPLQDIETKQWRSILAKNFPERWEKYREAFEERITDCREVYGDRIPANTAVAREVGWQLEIGKLLGRLLEKRDKSVADVARAPGGSPVVKQKIFPN